MKNIEARCRLSALVVKVHLGVNAHTVEIRAIEVTDNVIGDVPMLPQLLAQNPEDEFLNLVSADGAYGTKAYHEGLFMPKNHFDARRTSRVAARSPATS